MMTAQDPPLSHTHTRGLETQGNSADNASLRVEMCRLLTPTARNQQEGVVGIVGGIYLRNMEDTMERVKAQDVYRRI